MRTPKKHIRSTTLNVRISEKMLAKLAYIANYEFISKGCVFLKCAESALDQWYALVAKQEKEQTAILKSISDS